MSGITPGAIVPPVFKTDFGLIGIQICFDAHWPEQWRSLKESSKYQGKKRRRI